MSPAAVAAATAALAVQNDRLARQNARPVPPPVPVIVRDVDLAILRLARARRGQS